MWRRTCQQQQRTRLLVKTAWRRSMSNGTRRSNLRGEPTNKTRESSSAPSNTERGPLRALKAAVVVGVVGAGSIVGKAYVDDEFRVYCDEYPVIRDALRAVLGPRPDASKQLIQQSDALVSTPHHDSAIVHTSFDDELKEIEKKKAIDDSRRHARMHAISVQADKAAKEETAERVCEEDAASKRKEVEAITAAAVNKKITEATAAAKKKEEEATTAFAVKKEQEEKAAAEVAVKKKKKEATLEANKGEEVDSTEKAIETTDVRIAQEKPVNDSEVNLINEKIPSVSDEEGDAVDDGIKNEEPSLSDSQLALLEEVRSHSLHEIVERISTLEIALKEQQMAEGKRTLDAMQRQHAVEKRSHMHELEMERESHRRELQKELQNMRESFESLIQEEQSNAEKNNEELRTHYEDKITTAVRYEAEMREAYAEQRLARQERMLNAHWEAEMDDYVGKEVHRRNEQLELLYVRLTAIETVLGEQNAFSSNGQAHHRFWEASLHFANDAAAGVPLSESASLLRAMSGDHPLVLAALDSLPSDSITHGVQSRAQLRTRFESVRREVRRSAMVPAEGGFLAHTLSTVFSWLMFHPKPSLVDGDDANSILARTEHWLERGNLDLATRELNQLKGWPRRVARDWISNSRARLEVEQAARLFSAFSSNEGLSYA